MAKAMQFHNTIVTGSMSIKAIGIDYEGTSNTLTVDPSVSNDITYIQMKTLLLCLLILVPMVMAVDILPHDRESLIPYCQDPPDNSIPIRDTCTYFLGQDMMAVQ